MPEMNEADEVVQIDLVEIKERLLKLKAQLQHDVDMKEQQIAESGDELDSERGGVGNHQADDANDTFEMEAMMALQNTAQRDLDGINTALERLEAGTYGTCANCGKKINPARLQARPSSFYCIDCQELADRGKI